jgi:hypothetical protein
MLEKSLGILFFLRKPSPFKQGPRLIFLRITVDGKPKELSLKRKWEISKWLTRPGRAAGTKLETKALNEYLDIIRPKVYEARRKLIESGRWITAEAIRNIITGKEEKQKMLIPIFEHHK